jgi:ABC-2 type transport system permease protein
MLLRMRAEEGGGPLESILATAVSRRRWMISHLVNAALGSLGLLLIFATGMALAAGAVLGDTGGQLGDLLVAALLQLPAIFAIGGAVAAVTVALPRWAGALSWILVITFILLGPLFGAATFQLPEWTQDLSPFTHTPKLPGAEITAFPVIALIAIAAGIVASGLRRLRHRNLQLPA